MKHEIDAILADHIIEGSRQWLDWMFPPSCTLIFDAHPVWTRGSLTTHQPITDGTPGLRVSEPREDGVWVEYTNQTIDRRFKWEAP